jgi:hypothetical protein
MYDIECIIERKKCPQLKELDDSPHPITKPVLLTILMSLEELAAMDPKVPWAPWDKEEIKVPRDLQDHPRDWKEWKDRAGILATVVPQVLPDQLEVKVFQEMMVWWGDPGPSGVSGKPGLQANKVIKELAEFKVRLENLGMLVLKDQEDHRVNLD